VAHFPQIWASLKNPEEGKQKPKARIKLRKSRMYIESHAQNNHPKNKKTKKKPTKGKKTKRGFFKEREGNESHVVSRENAQCV
jgi:hypothetical protein